MSGRAGHSLQHHLFDDVEMVLDLFDVPHQRVGPDESAEMRRNFIRLPKVFSSLRLVRHIAEDLVHLAVDVGHLPLDATFRLSEAGLEQRHLLTFLSKKQRPHHHHRPIPAATGCEGRGNFPCRQAAPG